MCGKKCPWNSAPGELKFFSCQSACQKDDYMTILSCQTACFKCRCHRSDYATRIWVRLENEENQLILRLHLKPRRKRLCNTSEMSSFRVKYKSGMNLLPNSRRETHYVHHIYSPKHIWKQIFTLCFCLEYQMLIYNSWIDESIKILAQPQVANWVPIDTDIWRRRTNTMNRGTVMQMGCDYGNRQGNQQAETCW